MARPLTHASRRLVHVEGQDNKLISKVQRGCLLHDRVLRLAMVVAGKRKDGAEDDRTE